MSGEIEDVNIKLRYHFDDSFSFPHPTRSGGTDFLGRYKDPAFTIRATTGNILSGDTLYAKWGENNTKILLTIPEKFILNKTNTNERLITQTYAQITNTDTGTFKITDKDGTEDWYTTIEAPDILLYQDKKAPLTIISTKIDQNSEIQTGIYRYLEKNFTGTGEISDTLGLYAEVPAFTLANEYKGEVILTFYNE
ncbi:MAG: hypothetical protein K6E76_05165 [Patescibacteria group bacterium]|nr:hypothetical protein [Patescibacteria group bacterium]